MSGQLHALAALSPKTESWYPLDSRLGVSQSGDKKILETDGSQSPACRKSIPTERQPPVGEVTANFCAQSAPRGQSDGSLRPYSRQGQSYI
jgi:hypothetical protein